MKRRSSPQATRWRPSCRGRLSGWMPCRHGRWIVRCAHGCMWSTRSIWS